MRRLWTLGLVLVLAAAVAAARPGRAASPPSEAEVAAAFGRQGIRLGDAEAAAIRPDVLLALEEARAHGVGNSKVDFAAVEIATRLSLDVSPGSATVRNVVAAIRDLLGPVRCVAPPPPPPPPAEWSRYFERTLSLWSDAGFLSLVREKGFFPVRISWEDIGRHEGSVWGDRISDVGIWVREDERDPASARLALSVRRDSNFRDEVLVVPASAIKVHRRAGGRTVETTLDARLRELGLASARRDRHVIVSNQFAIVPVPGRGMRGAWAPGAPPRAAFTFSVFPYGSTNLVITDVIEGSHEAVVGPGRHQLLFADVDGRRAPFTASRAEDRPDLLRLERELRAQGMDVDVQRYYLVQVPLRRDAGVRPSSMGAPPWRRHGLLTYETAVPPAAGEVPGGVVGGMVGGAASAAPASSRAPGEASDEGGPGLARVAIGHGETEGPYDPGSGHRGARAEEPVRVTVVYFVTPVGEVTRADMESFARAFARWDEQAIWGGSFVTKETF
jgi:hypothetical protein